jgi:hypothetical protein
MKLGHIFLSIETWKKLSELKINSKVIYKVFKYMKSILAEYDIIEKQRIALIYEVTKTEPGIPVKLEPNTPEYVEYFKKFNALLSVDSDIKPLDMTLEQLVESNCDLTLQDLSILEPFFTE